MINLEIPGDAGYRARDALRWPSARRKDSPAHRGISTPQAHGRRRLARRLLPMRGCGLQRCASTWLPSVSLRAETDDRWDLSHVQLHDWPYFHRTVNLEDRAALGSLHRLVQVTGLDQRVAADNILGLGKRPICHCLLLAFHQLAGMFEGLAWVLDMTFVSKLLHPGHPFLHHLLHFIRGSTALAAAIKIYKLAHGNSSLVCYF